MYEQFGNYFIGDWMKGAVFAGVMALMFLVFIAIYVYVSMAWMTIAQSLKYKRAWLAWIPIANIAMMFQLAGFHWAWVFLILIPVAGWLTIFVLIIVATWKIFERKKYPGWFSLSIIIPQIGFVLYMIAIGFVAWQKK
ncbi:MAG: DUF5684 domain-containing protein [Candidatus Pacearchaeota archaeon]